MGKEASQAMQLEKLANRISTPQVNFYWTSLTVLPTPSVVRPTSSASLCLLVVGCLSQVVTRYVWLCGRYPCLSTCRISFSDPSLTRLWSLAAWLCLGWYIRGICWTSTESKVLLSAGLHRPKWHLSHFQNLRSTQYFRASRWSLSVFVMLD